MKSLAALIAMGALSALTQPALAQDRPAMPDENASETTMTTPSRTDNTSAMPATREYPVCGGEVQDSCINPREAGLNYGNRPLEYWPGRPASEIEGDLPAERSQSEERGNRPN